jgi:hypothetical protein
MEIASDTSSDDEQDLAIAEPQGFVISITEDRASRSFIHRFCSAFVENYGPEHLVRDVWRVATFAIRLTTEIVKYHCDTVMIYFSLSPNETYHCCCVFYVQNIPTRLVCRMYVF